LAPSQIVDYRQFAQQFFEAYKNRSRETWHSYCRYIRIVLSERDQKLTRSTDDHEKWFQEVLDLSEGFLKLASTDRLAAKQKIIAWLGRTTMQGNSIEVT
jgi:hypothetical protein